MEPDVMTKLCKNCDYHQKTGIFGTTSVCTVPTTWQINRFLTTGKLRYAITCHRARRSEAYCGEKAIHFVELVTVP